MKQTISVLVENQAGALNRITGVFARRAFNIESLAVGVTDDPTISRITIIVDSGNSVVEQVEKQLRLGQYRAAVGLYGALQHDAGAFEHHIVVVQTVLIMIPGDPARPVRVHGRGLLVRDVHAGAGSKLL